MSDELKTLEDMPKFFPQNEGRAMGKSFPTMISSIQLRQEAIKWIKEDIKIMKKGIIFPFDITEKWMKRLNITEEDLK